jgi:hypothetical protein
LPWREASEGIEGIFCKTCAGFAEKESEVDQFGEEMQFFFLEI